MTVANGPVFELQKAMAVLAGASADLKTLIGDPIRLYQKVPADRQFPYVTIGEMQRVPDLADCIDGSEVLPTVHILSRAATFDEADKIGAALDAALVGATFTMTGFRCLLFELDDLGDQQLKDPDGQTLHIAKHYRALIEPV